MLRIFPTMTIYARQEKSAGGLFYEQFMAELYIKGSDIPVRLDDADLALVRGRKWRAMRKGNLVYAVASERKGATLMHRLILGAPRGMFVDHINGDGLDNRRENIRLCTNSQNMMNIRKSPGRSSRFKGVSWDTKNRKWVAQIEKNRITTYLGGLDSEERAARQYDRAARLMFGKFARTNIMMGLLAA